MPGSTWKHTKLPEVTLNTRDYKLVLGSTRVSQNYWETLREYQEVPRNTIDYQEMLESTTNTQNTRRVEHFKKRLENTTWQYHKTINNTREKAINAHPYTKPTSCKKESKCLVTRQKVTNYHMFPVLLFGNGVFTNMNNIMSDITLWHLYFIPGFTNSKFL